MEWRLIGTQHAAKHQQNRINHQFCHLLSYVQQKKVTELESRWGGGGGVGGVVICLFCFP